MLGSPTKHLERWEAVHLTIKDELKIGLVIFLRGRQHTMGHSCYGRHACCSELQTKQSEAVSHELQIFSSKRQEEKT